jgi:hypothetical protein
MISQGPGTIQRLAAAFLVLAPDKKARFLMQV